jgi:hypothetical protein
VGIEFERKKFDPITTPVGAFVDQRPVFSLIGINTRDTGVEES